jgi:hypothetical protein
MVALHAADLLAFWIQAAQQNPVVVQFKQNATPMQVQMVSDVGWKWWLSALAPWVGPLLSGVVSIYVAWRVFRWQGEKEREQWLRDQKKNEWSNLLRCIAEVQRILIPSDETPEHNAKQIARELHPAIREVWIAAESCVFTKEFLERDENRKRFNSYLGKASQCVIKVRQMLKSATDSFERDDLTGDITRLLKLSSNDLDQFGKLIFELNIEFRKLLAWIREESLKNLAENE